METDVATLLDKASDMYDPVLQFDGGGPESKLADRELEVMRLFGEGWRRKSPSTSTSVRRPRTRIARTSKKSSN